jgi:hypothetical protein
MATVADLSGNFPASLPSGVDRKRSDYSRIIGGSPITLATTPAFAGEIVLNNVTGDLWYAKDTTVAGWTPFVLSY